LIGLVAILAYSLARLATIMPAYAATASALLQGIALQLAAIGIGIGPIREMIAALDLNRVAGWLTSGLRAILGVGANVIFLLSLLLFLGIESTGAAQRLSTLMTTRPRAGAALIDFAVKTRRYLAVTGIFAVIVGLADTLLLFLLGIPLAGLWGLLAAACNFIPYVGFVIGVIPPALLALLDGDWQLMIFVIVAYIILNSLFTTLIPPYFVGDAVEMSITLTLISVVFWAWVLGPLGAVLAIPITLLVKSELIGADPRAAWAATLIGSTRTGPRRRIRRANQVDGHPS
jgi:AI-2 transport protein TqsA